MRTGIDYRPALLSGTGIGRYTREIAGAVAARLAPGEELRLFGVSLAGPRFPFPGGAPGGRVVLAGKRFPGRLLHLLGRFGLAGVETFTGPLDLFLYTDLVFPPLKRGTPYLVMVHDLAFLRSGSFHEKGFGRSVWKRMAPRLEGAAALLAPSPATADDVGRFLPAWKGRIHVVPHGGDHLPRPNPAGGRLDAGPQGARRDGSGPEAAPGERAGPDLPGPYFLAVGTFEPRKNHLGVLAAFEMAAERLPGTSLVFAGTPGWLYRPFLARLETSPVRRRVRLVAGPGDDTLARLYAGALGLVYPSLWEGFGLPVAEALHLGCPVITSDRGALPWVAGKAALLVDPASPAGLAAAMERLARERTLREDLAAAGLERASRFTWARAGAATLALFRRIAAGGAGPPSR